MLVLQLLKELDAPVEHIVLPTFAYEHKVFVGPFSRRFPRAKVWTAPSQWSWPVNLPLPLLGIFSSAELSDASAPPPWADEINFKVLATPEVGPHFRPLSLSQPFDSAPITAPPALCPHSGSLSSCVPFLATSALGPALP